MSSPWRAYKFGPHDRPIILSAFADSHYNQLVKAVALPESHQNLSSSAACPLVEGGVLKKIQILGPYLFFGKMTRLSALGHDGKRFVTSSCLSM